MPNRLAFDCGQFVGLKSIKRQISDSLMVCNAHTNDQHEYSQYNNNDTIVVGCCWWR